MSIPELCNRLDERDEWLTRERNRLIARANRLHMARQVLRQYSPVDGA